jgi:hypothetical protein
MSYEKSAVPDFSDLLHPSQPLSGVLDLGNTKVSVFAGV